MSATLLRPVALAAALLLVTLLPAPAVAPGGVMTFASPIAVGGGGEPGIQTDPSGSPYYVESASDIWRSDNGGSSWTHLNPPQRIAGDANAAVGSTGTLYYQSLWIGDSWSFTSFDHGATWPTQTPFSTQAAVDRNWIAAYGPSTVYAKADMFSGVQTPLIFKSTDSGATYLPTLGLVDGATSPSGGFKGALTVDPASGALYLPADQATNVLSSTDGGDHLVYAAVPNPHGSSYTYILDVAVDDAGNAYLAWISQDGNAWTLQYSWSANHGASWSTPNVVATGGGASRVYPWSVANGTGGLEIAWYETDSTTAAPDNAPTSAPWHVNVAQVTSANSATPTISIVAATGTIHTGTICTQGVTCTGDRDLLDFLGISLDPRNGDALVVYTDDTHSGGTVEFVKQNGGATI